MFTFCSFNIYIFSLQILKKYINESLCIILYKWIPLHYSSVCVTILHFLPVDQSILTRFALRRDFISLAIHSPSSTWTLKRQPDWSRSLLLSLVLNVLTANIGRGPGIVPRHLVHVHVSRFPENNVLERTCLYCAAGQAWEASHPIHVFRYVSPQLLLQYL